MNRSIVLVGGLFVVGAFVLFSYPIATTGHETLGLPIELGVFLLGEGLGVVLLGAVSPNPELFTIGGWFGNRDEDRVRRWLSRHPPKGPARFQPSPFESVNCETCNTAFPSRTLDCPRCGNPRRCRTCRKRLYYLAGAVRCAPCLKDEVYCSCPSVRHRRVARFGRHG